MSADSETYILDASHEIGGGLFCFCPVEFSPEGKFEGIVTGLNFLSTEPPEGSRFYGVTHEAGQAACERWCDEHAETVDDLRHRFGDLR